MAPPTGRSKVQDKQLAAALESELGVKPEKHNLGDTASLKRALDDAVVQTVSSAGYVIDHVYTDCKIVLGFLACAVACLAQFWPGKYPDTYWVLAGCVATYTLLSMAVTAVATWLEKDTIALTKQGPGLLALEIRSALPRFQETYTLAVRPRGAPAGGPEEVKLEKSVGAYFDAEGVLHADVIEADVAALLQRLTAAKSKAQ